jgi:hypothetical protein
VWFGGYGSSVSVFDGSSWTNFTESNSKIGSTEIWSAMADNNGNIWFGTDGQGLVEFIPDAPADVASLNPIGTALAIYPNPTSSTLHLVSSASDIVITDLLGRTWLHSINGARDLNISELPQGVYSISDGTSRAQFVKE